MRQNITIKVSESGTPAARTLNCKILANGEVRAETDLNPVESQEAREMSAQYINLFDHGCKTEAQDYLPILSAGIFRLFLEKSWTETLSIISHGADFIVASPLPEVLMLPWEHIRFPSPVDATLGFDERFSIRRLPDDRAQLADFSSEIPPGPMRVLFMACEPSTCEEEERFIQRAAEGVDMILQAGETGSFSELQFLAGAFRPQVVHLAGQARTKNGQAYFSFQDEAGRPDLRTADELAAALAECGVQCAVLSGCQADTLPSLDIFCQLLARNNLPAVSWRAASEQASPFYRAISLGKNIDEALGALRLFLEKAGQTQGSIFSLPVLYSSDNRSMLFDPLQEDKDHALFKMDREQHPLPGMTEGYSQAFVNRRLDLQRLASALSEGTVRTLIITGRDGTGKSVLATKLAGRMALLGYSLLPIYSSFYNPISAVRILEAVIASLSGTEQLGRIQMLKNQEIPLPERLKAMLDLLGELRFLILLDDLDLDPKTARIKDPILAEFYIKMIREINGSRLIITSSALPSDALTLPGRTWEWKLSGITQASFIRYLLLDQDFAEMYRKGEIHYQKLQDLYASFGQNSSCLALLSRALRTTGEFKGCDDVLEGLVASLDQPSREALRRASVFNTIIPTAGLAAAAAITETEIMAAANEWRRLSLINGVGNLWTVPSFAKPGLFDGLAPDERRASHLAAGDYLENEAKFGGYEAIGLTRLDCRLEARGHYLTAGNMERAREITARISSYLQRRGYYSELIKLNEEILEKEAHAAPMNWIANAYLRSGDPAAAKKWYLRAAQIEPDAVSYHGLGTAYLLLGDWDLARDGFQKEAQICQEKGDLQGQAEALQGLARAEMEKNEIDHALESLQKAADIQGALGNLSGEATTLQSMAMIGSGKGYQDTARKMLEKALELLQEIGDKSGRTSALFNLGSLYLEAGEIHLARKAFREALGINRELGNRKGEADTLHSLGLIETKEGAKEEAWADYKLALGIYQELGDKAGEAGAFFQLGAVAVQMDKIHEGLKLMALSAVILRSIGSDDIKSVEPLVERLASQLNYSQAEFLEMVQEVVGAYRRDRGFGLVERATGR